MPHDHGQNFLRAAAALVGSASTEQVSDLEGILRQRLAQYHLLLDVDRLNEDGHSLQELQLQTAKESLYVLDQLQNIWSQDAISGPSLTSLGSEQASASTIGARDLRHIRTLLAIVFKWAVEPLLDRVVSAIPTKSSQLPSQTGPKIIDLTGVPADFTSLSACVFNLLHLALPDGWEAPLCQTVITSTLLNNHLTSLLRPCMVLGWLPKNLASESIRPVDELRPFVMRLLSILPASQTIAAFGGIVSDNSLALPYVRKSCGFLLSRQLIRPEGVASLLAVVFGEEDVSGEDAPLEKLDHVGRLLTTIPASMKPEDYYGTIVPRLLSVISADADRVPPAHRRAVAFCVSRMLSADENTGSRAIVSKILLPILHHPFLYPTQGLPARQDDDNPSLPLSVHQSATISTNLEILQTLLTNADPSPSFITGLLTAILPPLYSIFSHLEATKTSDPALKESVQGLLSTWGRVVGASEGIEALWQIILGEGGDWKSDVAGNLTRLEAAEHAPPLSLFTPEDLKRAEESGDLDVDSNFLDLRPDPARFVRFLKSIERADISSELFVKLLEAYREIKAEADADPLQTLLYLQLILQMQNQLAVDDSASSILSKPDHILSFIKHALESATTAVPPQRNAREPASVSGLRMEDLRIVPEEEEESDEGDSDDEAPDMNSGGTGDDEMVVTAVNLLLSILEAQPDLSARTAPILNDIFLLLEPLSRDSTDTVRPLAREARMVLTARLASTSAPPLKGKSKRTKDDEESPQETYQKALKLLQDPLLPVRAHGLLLLRQLVSARQPKSPSRASGLEEPVIDRALVPAILSIFLQSVQDDDSYMYLNAVQGLAAMVDGFGRDVLKGLINTYTEGLEGLGGTGMTQQEVDVRTRVGEALGQVIRRCGEALPAYSNVLIPPLFQVMRTSHFPTTLRVSAVSLLAQCAKTNSLAILPYAADLSEAMIDLLQVETVSATQRRKQTPVETVPDEGPTSGEEAEPPAPPTMDSQPTSTNAKFPPLRRAALHFLSLLITACISRLYESADGEGLAFPQQLVRRAKTTLGYVAATDADAVVRVMARETLEALDQLAEALVGL